MSLRHLPFALALIATAASAPASERAAPVDDDLSAIRSAALDYAEGWYSGDRERMARSLHESLAKRAYLPDAAGKRMLNGMDKDELLAANRPANLERYRDAPRQAEVEILDRYGNAASVRLKMDGWVDYLHVVRDDQGQWRIINVLWELDPA
ncbi:nuclear transport factor 2 family protein [Pseudoxanthomonas suwonensis]|uniref:DUF4440 domain-containing protein n=1 Tax=Pseudoxanthomonas suwonensis TaxID=314722 RepID=A0A0E3UPU2_9GAMM|nr:nuclear transport factor 2 family protein [Pseudoxanthomonas suwonensis]AKC88115.1 hypothetical protein WQ53_01465 [Pseudoxanthomonas suwonensis]